MDSMFWFLMGAASTACVYLLISLIFDMVRPITKPKDFEEILKDIDQRINVLAGTTDAHRDDIRQIRHQHDALAARFERLFEFNLTNKGAAKKKR